MSPLETGGMLLGYMKNNDYFIKDHVKAGNKAIHLKDYFLPDGNYQQPILEEKYLASDGRITFLGDWHSHPYNKAYMSSLDRKTLAKISSDKNAQISTPIFIILGTLPFEIKGWEYLNGVFKEHKIIIINKNY